MKMNKPTPLPLWYVTSLYNKQNNHNYFRNTNTSKIPFDIPSFNINDLPRKVLSNKILRPSNLKYLYGLGIEQ
jgi:hypothetical protein